MEKKNTTAGKEHLSARKLFFASAVFLMALTLGLGILICSRKHVEFCDESLSYESANSVWKDYVYDRWNEWIGGEDIEAYYAATDLNPHLITIMKKLWVDHVPFYFWLLRIASLIVHGSASPWIGLGLNLFCTMLFLFWAFAAVGKRTAYDKCVMTGILLFSLLFFLSSPLFFSQLTLIRMYLLLTLFQFMFFWYAGTFLLEEDVPEGKRRLHAGVVLVGACGLLTHYLFLPFYGVTVFLMFLFVLVKARKKLWPFIRMNLATLILSCAMDPYWIYRLFRYNLLPRGDSGEGKAFEPLKILYRTVKRLALDPFSGKLELLPAILLVALVFGAALLLMSKKGRKKLRTVFLLFTAADFLYLCAVNVMSDGTGRYSGPAVAVWMLLLYGAAVYVFLELLTAGKGRLRLLSILPAAFLGLVLCINIAKSTSPGGIDGLCADSAEPLLKEQYAEIPWVVFCHEHTWYEEGVAYKYMIPEKLCFVSPDHPAEAGIALPEEFVLVCADADLTEALDYLEELDGSSPEQTDEIAWGTMAARRMRIH